MKPRKDQLRVTIFTPQHKIVGEIHLYENSRLSDILNTENLSKDFLPITQAEVTDLKTGNTVQANFISVNKNHIELVLEEA
ncbi:MAG: hypothetical protein PWR01_4254 [Clostridiales bacterium]|jgi:hypothetical protein|nr:hypothetical protein [Clostridiales bacterium]MDN5283181.1 hypothetical protein [Candidatus Ozemobacter sp.]